MGMVVHFRSLNRISEGKYELINGSFVSTKNKTLTLNSATEQEISEFKKEIREGINIGSQFKNIVEERKKLRPTDIEKRKSEVKALFKQIQKK